MLTLLLPTLWSPLEAASVFNGVLLPAASPSYAQLAGITAPIWLKLVRIGNQFSGYYSSDNVNWIQIGSTVTIAMGATANAGMVACAHSTSQLATATFTDVALTGSGSQPPSVSIPAAAGQSPVNGTTVSLSVLGADDGGETNLIYTWATTGNPPAAVAFSSNGQNASKNTIATFTRAGTYSLVVTIADQAGLSTTSNVDVTVNQALASIAVGPATVALNENGTQQFTAMAKDQFDFVLLIQPAFTWTTAGGSVDAAGLYTAPFASGSFLITAGSGAVKESATASVTLIPGDTDGDGKRTFVDLNTLLAALSNVPDYQSSHNLSQNDLLTVSDLDADGVLTNLDVSAELKMLANASGGSSALLANASATAAVLAPLEWSSATTAVRHGSAKQQLCAISGPRLPRQRSVRDIVVNSESADLLFEAWPSRISQAYYI